MEQKFRRFSASLNQGTLGNRWSPDSSESSLFLRFMGSFQEAMKWRRKGCCRWDQFLLLEPPLPEGNGTILSRIPYLRSDIDRQKPSEADHPEHDGNLPRCGVSGSKPFCQDLQEKGRHPPHRISEKTDRGRCLRIERRRDGHSIF